MTRPNFLKGVVKSFPAVFLKRKRKFFFHTVKKENKMEVIYAVEVIECPEVLNSGCFQKRLRSKHLRACLATMVPGLDSYPLLLANKDRSFGAFAERLLGTTLPRSLVLYFDSSFLGSFRYTLSIEL